MAKVLYLISLLSLIVGTSAQGFLREGFSSQMGSDARSETKLEENESASGMTREMFLMKEIDWELHLAEFSKIKDGKLRRHIESFLKEPVTLKLSTRKGKYGLRAMGQLPSGKRLRAFWRQTGGGALPKGDFLSASYDDAVRTRLSMLEFEVQLPPLGKKKGLPSVIYSVAVEPGTMNAKAIVPRGAGVVKVLPKGRNDEKEEISLGKSMVSLPMRAGIVDPGWAKGRAVFRNGRSTGSI